MYVYCTQPSSCSNINDEESKTINNGRHWVLYLSLITSKNVATNKTYLASQIKISGPPQHLSEKSLRIISHTSPPSTKTAMSKTGKEMGKQLRTGPHNRQKRSGPSKRQNEKQTQKQQ